MVARSQHHRGRDQVRDPALTAMLIVLCLIIILLRRLQSPAIEDRVRRQKSCSAPLGYSLLSFHEAGLPRQSQAYLWPRV
jgi:hypothetical protein